MTTAEDILQALEACRDETQARHLTRFFKTGPGDYGEGDRFMGLRVPQTRAIVREARGTVALCEVERLLYSPWHEARLAGLLLLVDAMRGLCRGRRARAEGAPRERDGIAEFYLRHARQANNWDLVDMSCRDVLGEWLLQPGADGLLPDRSVLDRLAESECLWEQRIGIVTTWRLIKAGQFDDTLRLSAALLGHTHDLMHKAVGWMLREVGKRDMDTLRGFLEEHHAQMPRTALRYAIERMAEAERREWLRR